MTNPVRTLKLFLTFSAAFMLLGMAYTAHRGFDWPEIAIISIGGSIAATVVWQRRFKV